MGRKPKSKPPAKHVPGSGVAPHSVTPEPAATTGAGGKASASSTSTSDVPSATSGPFSTGHNTRGRSRVVAPAVTQPSQPVQPSPSARPQPAMTTTGPPKAGPTTTTNTTRGAKAANGTKATKASNTASAAANAGSSSKGTKVTKTTNTANAGASSKATKAKVAGPVNTTNPGGGATNSGTSGVTVRPKGAAALVNKPINTGTSSANAAAPSKTTAPEDAAIIESNFGWNDASSLSTATQSGPNTRSSARLSNALPATGASVNGTAPPSTTTQVGPTTRSSIRLNPGAAAFSPAVKDNQLPSSRLPSAPSTAPRSVPTTQKQAPPSNAPAPTEPSLKRKNASSPNQTNSTKNRSSTKNKRKTKIPRIHSPILQPKVVIDHAYFPDIIDEILSHKESWIAMRGTSKAFYERVNSMMYRHIVIKPVFRDSADSDDEQDDNASGYDSWDDDEDEENLDPLLLDVRAPSFGLPGFKPRYYDSIWGYSKKDFRRLEASADLLGQYTRVVELPVQLSRVDADWFYRESKVETARLFHDPALSFRPTNLCNDIGFRYHIAPLVSAKVVLLPGQSLKAFDFKDECNIPVDLSRNSCEKVVSHVAYSAACGPSFIRRAAEDEPAYGPRPNPDVDMVYIFNKKTTRAKGHTCSNYRWDSLAVDIVENVYFNYAHGYAIPTIYLVDLPSSCADLLDNPFLSRLESVFHRMYDDVMVDEIYEHRLGMRGHTCPNCGTSSGPHDHGSPSEEHALELFLSKIRTMTRAEYAATLAPGEFEAEEWY